MADEKRIATFEWLVQNLGTCKKGTPPTTKKGVRKDELLANYNVNISLVSNRENNRLVTREVCVCNSTPEGTVGFNGAVHAIDIQSDGKIVVGGAFTMFGSTPMNRIARFNEDGTLDTTFSIGSGFNSNGSTVKCVKVLPDGSIVASGRFDTYNGVTSKDLVKLNSDGSKNTTFSVSVFNGGTAVYDIEYNSVNGDIIVATDHTSYGSVSQRGVLALNSSASLSSMGAFMQRSPYLCYSLFVDNLNSGLLATSYIVEGGSTYVNRVSRVTLNGYNRDTSFNSFVYPTGLLNTNYMIKDITLLPENSLLYYGIFRNSTSESNTSASNISIRSLSTGVHSASNFDNMKLIGTNDVDLANSIEYSSGNVFIGGNFTDLTETGVSKYVSYIAKFSSSGVFDKAFANNVKLNAMVRKIKKDSNGKILVGGDFSQDSSGNTLDYLVRLNADGTIDKKFLV